MLTRRRMLTLGCLALCVAPVFYVFTYVMAFSVNRLNISSDDYTRMQLRNDGLIAGVQKLNEILEQDECVLVFRLAEYAYYGRHCYYSYLDSRLIPLYKASSAAEAAEFLGQKNIRYVMRPKYGMAEIYNSKVGSLLADPSTAELIYEHQGASIFRIRGVDEVFWADSSTTGFSSRDFHLRHQEEESRIDHKANFRGLGFWPGFLTTGNGSDLLPLSGYTQELYEEETLLRYSLTLEGDTTGYVSLAVVDYAQSGRQGASRWARREHLLWGGVINQKRIIKGQLLRRAGSSKRFRYVVSLRGPGTLGVREMTVEDFGPSGLVGGLSARSRARHKGWDSFSKGRSSESWEWGMDRDFQTGEDFYFLNALNDRSYVLATRVQALPPATRAVELEYQATNSAPYRLVVEWLGEKSISWHPAAIAEPIFKVANILERIIFDDVLGYTFVGLDKFSNEVVKVLERSSVALPRTQTPVIRQTLPAPSSAVGVRMLFIFDVDPSLPVEEQRELIVSNLHLTLLQ